MMSRFEPQFPLQHQQKDMRLSINMADSVDQPLHVATAVNEVSVFLKRRSNARLFLGLNNSVSCDITQIGIRLYSAYQKPVVGSLAGTSYVIESVGMKTTSR